MRDRLMPWLIDNIAPSLIVAAIIAIAGFVGRRWLVDLWSRRPWPPIRRVPRTPAETRRLIARRPDGWEYMLLAASLYQEMDKRAENYRDHRARYVKTSDVVVTDDDVESFLEGERAKIINIIGNWSNLLNGPALEAAIGAPGEPADPVEMAHFADRMGATYVAVMDWAARLRGSRHPLRYRRIFDLVARFIDTPIEEYRAWVLRMVETLDGFPARIAERRRMNPPPPLETVELTLTLTVDPEALRAYEAERQRLVRGDPDPDDEDD